MILKQTQNKQEIFQIIMKCSNQLLKEGLDHWANYYTLEKIEEKLKHGQFYLIQNDNETKGIINYSTKLSDAYTKNNDGIDGEIIDYSNYFSPTNNFVFLSAFGILPEFQRKGLGTKVVSDLVDYFRIKGYEFIRMHVRITGQEYLCR